MDPADTFAHGCVQPFVRIFAFAAAIWAGGLVAGFSIGMGEVVVDPFHGLVELLNCLIHGPLLLLSKWFFLNLVLVIGGLGWFVRTERNLANFWGVLVAVYGFLGVAGNLWAFDFNLWQKLAVWLTYPILCAVLAAAIKFVEQWRLNRWAVEIAMLQAENAQRRAELESRGIATFDREPDD